MAKRKTWHFSIGVSKTGKRGKRGGGDQLPFFYWQFSPPHVKKQVKPVKRVFLRGWAAKHRFHHLYLFFVSRWWKMSKWFLAWELRRTIRSVWFSELKKMNERVYLCKFKNTGFTSFDAFTGSVSEICHLEQVRVVNRQVCELLIWLRERIIF